MGNLKKLFEETLPEYYSSEEYKKAYGHEVENCETPYVALKNKSNE